MADREQFRLGLVGYGEIGSTLGAGLRGAGLESIACYDKYAFDGPYADLIQARAREAGVTLVRSNGELAEAAELIVSVTPGVASLESADAFAPVLDAPELAPGGELEKAGVRPMLLPNLPFLDLLRGQGFRGFRAAMEGGPGPADGKALGPMRQDQVRFDVEDLLARFGALGVADRLP